MALHAIFLALALLAAPPAQAGTVTVVIDPFSPTYVPAPHAGFVWVPGSYDPYGFYTPGYWQPTGVRVGYLWVPGYWIGHTYHDGYWRPHGRDGQAWIDGYYLDGRYVPGRWVGAGEFDHVRAQIHAARSHARATRHVEASGHDSSTRSSSSSSRSAGSSSRHSSGSSSHGNSKNKH
jgi:hypothetical protein